jgi:hypothetical protein
VSADHRKPVVAFIVLAVLAAALVGFQRADAGTGQFLAALAGVGDPVEGTLPRADTWTAGGEAVLAHPPIAGFTLSDEAVADGPPHLPGEAAGSATPRTNAAKTVPPKGRAAEVQPGARGVGRRVAAGLRRTASDDATEQALGRTTHAATRSLRQARHAVDPVTRGHAAAKVLRRTSGLVLRQMAVD